MSYTNGLDKPSNYFETNLHTGTGSTHNITSLDFAPNFVWLKSRTQGGTGYNGMHYLFDTIRGATKRVRANDDSAEATSSASLTSFNSDGFTLGSDDIVNFNGDAFVSWNWKAGGTAASNTDGSITSSVSANQTAGFSIVSYTGNATNGATVGHGLSSAPQMVITKSRGDAGAWQVLTNIYTSYSEGDYIYLNETSAKANSANVSFLPTSTTWQMKSGQAGNTASTKIAYCFHSVKGFSKFGSYTGNGNADGTFVYTGFKPSFVIIKRTDSSTGGYWVMFDNKRNTFNVMDKYLFAQTSDAEDTSNLIDFYSNGFRPIVSNLMHNGSGASYIYMAFAENPFTTSTGVPATAR